MTFNDVFNYDNMYNAYKKCMKNVSWKGSVQSYAYHSISNIHNTLNELNKGCFKSGKFYTFKIFERGKERLIKSVNIKERVVQKCLCDNYLTPLITRKLIYDNYACIKGKGYHFAIKRMKKFLHDYYLKNKTNEGYILQFDFSKYFDTIPHKELIDMLKQHIKDEKLMSLVSQLINDFKGDTGLGLGSQISQICSIYYPNYLDHYFSSKKDIHAYGRYMDDGFIIAKDKNTLIKYKKELIDIVENKLKLKINRKRTLITKLTKGFTFLKSRFILTNKGKIVLRPYKINIFKNRRKLKKLFKLKCDYLVIKNFFTTIYNNLKYYNAHALMSIFYKLYINLSKSYCII